MSFRDLESGHKVQRHSQPKQRRDEDSSYERSIKANIQEMQDSIRTAGDHLERAQRGCLSRRVGENLDKFLERSRDLSQETEQLFRDWTVHLAGEPTERHRKKFSYEKLQRAFEEEVGHLKEIAKKAVTAQQEALNAEGGGMECQPVCEEQDAQHGVEEEVGLLDDSVMPEVSQLQTQEDTAIRNRIAQEREEGIRRIQNQVSEVNQIFRDLASIVQEQGVQFETIEQQAESASTNTKQAVKELRKAVDRQRGTRERLCCMLAMAIMLLCFVLLPHVHGVYHHAVEPSVLGDGSARDSALVSEVAPSAGGPVRRQVADVSIG